MVKKKTIVVFVSILMIVLVILLGFYWFGYIEFHGTIPSFNPAPTNPSNGSSGPQTTPRLVIENIKGRFNKIHADIKNIGEMNAANVRWNISVTGGILKRINVISTGTIDTLSMNMGETVGTEKFIWGFGRVTIKVTAEAAHAAPVMMTARGFIVFFILIGVRA